MATDVKMEEAFWEWQNCEMGIQVARHPFVRFSQMCGILTSIVGFPFYYRLFANHFCSIGFHFNIKLILVLYYLTALLESFLFVITQSKQFILGFVVSNPCSIFLNKYEYMTFHLANLFLIQYQLCLLAAMLFERLVATLMSSFYEGRAKWLGFLLSFSMMFPPVICMWWAYKSEDFSDRATDAINTPLSAATRINELLAIQLAGCVFAAILIAFLWKYNGSQLKKTRYDLRKQYQLSENVTATKFILSLSLFTLVFYIFLYAATLVVKFFQDSVFFKERLPLFQGLRSITYVLPLFTLCLPLISSFLRACNRRDGVARREAVLATSESRGMAGWRIYSDQLDRQWNQPDLNRRNTTI